ncbi:MULTISPECIES: hypothetical protein [Paenibacillus]|uniref:hypothetical protein n=1 Tax=Paenibacillus TaxID=44249 RepID=UPI0022B91B23|nr:hypothetical protein [Paenibacillus caseinilyticus]MCZ8522127.1 hypothetical protein [Paenibacillus caseinilyticus]
MNLWPVLLRLTGGALLIGFGLWLRGWWHALLTESGGPDQGRELLVHAPYFIAMAFMAAGLWLLALGLQRLRSRN